MRKIMRARNRIIQRSLVCTLLQTENHTSTPPLCFFTGRMPFLPPNQQCQSTEGKRLQPLSIIFYTGQNYAQGGSVAEWVAC